MELYSETGTLIVVIPTADGIVVAADSRGVVRGNPIDGRKKLHVASTRRPVVFAVTGAADFPHACPPNVEFIDWMTDPLYVFRASDCVRSYLGRNPSFVLTEVALSAVAVDLAGAVSVFLSRCPQKLDEFSGRDICVLVVCQTESRESSLCGSVGLSVKPDGEVVLCTPTVRRYRSTDEKHLDFFGEWQYAWDVVVQGEGKQFLREEETLIWNARRLVKDLSGFEGARFASSIIEAAARTTAFVPIPSGSGIGGAVTALILTSTDVGPPLDGGRVTPSVTPPLSAVSVAVGPLPAADTTAPDGVRN